MRTDPLAADLDRLVDRLRHLPDTRLARPPRPPAGASAVSASSSGSPDSASGSARAPSAGAGVTSAVSAVTSAGAGVTSAGAGVTSAGVTPAVSAGAGMSSSGSPATTAAVTASAQSVSVDSVSPVATVADLAHVLAQRLADIARGIEGRDLNRPPAPRSVPRLGDLASGDLVAVAGGDVLLAARQVRADEPVWVDGVRRPAAVALAVVAAEVTALRSAL